MHNVLLGKSAHADRKSQLIECGWPRLLDIHLAAAYCSVGERTIEDWLYERILQRVCMPGTILRSKTRGVISGAKKRSIKKVLIDRQDLDLLINQRKGSDSNNPGGHITCSHCDSTTGECGFCKNNK